MERVPRITEKGKSVDHSTLYSTITPTPDILSGKLPLLIVAMPDNILSHIIDQARATPELQVMWLYGSRAKGNASADSDYDLAAAFSPVKLATPLDTRLRPELLALDWQQAMGIKDGMLSIVDINHAPIPLAFNAIAGQLLYCRDEARQLMEERRILSRMELDYQYHLKHYA